MLSKVSWRFFMLLVKVSVVVVISAIWVFKVYTCSIDVTIYTNIVSFIPHLLI